MSEPALRLAAVERRFRTEAGELPVAFVYQDEPLGLGHAILQAAPETGDEPFLVLLGDYFIPSHEVNRQLAKVSAEHGGC